MTEWIKAKLKAFALWFYEWATVIAGIATGVLAFVPDLLNMLTSMDLTPILPPKYAAAITTGIALAKALAVFVQSRRAVK